MSQLNTSVDDSTLLPKLANALAEYLLSLNYEVTHLLTPNPYSLPEPTQKGQHHPDLIARNTHGILVLGAVLVKTDFENIETGTRLLDYANRYDKETKLPIEFYIAVPDARFIRSIRKFFYENGFDKRKTNVVIVKLDIEGN